MSYLLDTQILIWWMEKSEKLSQNAYNLINDHNNQILISVGSIWEIVIKIAKKRLRLSRNIEHDIKNKGLGSLPIEISHVLKVEDLPLHHSDPFDRILIAQALAENLTLITSDKKIWKYKLKLIKA